MKNLKCWLSQKCELQSSVFQKVSIWKRLLANQLGKFEYTFRCLKRFFRKVPRKLRSAITLVEFLFRVLLCIGALSRLDTPHISVPLRTTPRSCQGETQKHGSTCLLRITMSLQIMSLENFIPKGRIQNFYSV